MCVLVETHPTVGEQQTFLSSLHGELNMSSDTRLRGNSSAQPHQHCYALVLKPLYQVLVKLAVVLCFSHLAYAFNRPYSLQYTLHTISDSSSLQ